MSVKSSFPIQNHDRFGINHKKSPVFHIRTWEIFNVNSQLSTLNCQLSTVNCSPPLGVGGLKRQLIPLLYFLPPDEVGTPVAILHQRHCSNEFASPIDIIVLEAADVQDEMWRHTHFLAHPLDICLRVVLVRRCPPLNDGAHGIAVVLHSICPQQSEGSPVAPLHCLELIKTLVVLHFQQTLPLILASTDIQRIAITDSSWYHNS